jgi:hypothetical protein
MLAAQRLDYLLLLQPSLPMVLTKADPPRIAYTPGPALRRFAGRENIPSAMSFTAAERSLHAVLVPAEDAAALTEGPVQVYGCIAVAARAAVEPMFIKPSDVPADAPVVHPQQISDHYGVTCDLLFTTIQSRTL